MKQTKQDKLKENEYFENNGTLEKYFDTEKM